jgi:hypothetical protein
MRVSRRASAASYSVSVVIVFGFVIFPPKIFAQRPDTNLILSVSNSCLIPALTNILSSATISASTIHITQNNGGGDLLH